MKRTYPFNTDLYVVWLIVSVMVSLLISILPVVISMPAGFPLINLAPYIAFSLFSGFSILGISSFTRWYWQINVLVWLLFGGYALYDVMVLTSRIGHETATAHFLRYYPKLLMHFVYVWIPIVLFYVGCRFSPHTETSQASR